MNRTLAVRLHAVALLALGIGGLTASAQTQGGGAVAPPSPVAPAVPPGPVGNLAAMRERVMLRMKEQLEATDEEWAILRPRIEKLMVLQVDARGGVGSAMMFLRLPPGFAAMLRAAGMLDALGPFAALLDSPVTLAAQELRGVLDDENARAADISFQLQGYRRARDKARAELGTAQNELRELLTPRQEALLTMQGLLD